MKNTQQHLAILLRNNNRDIRHEDGYATMQISIVAIEEGKVRNPNIDGPFFDLQFSAQWDTNTSDSHTYGWRLAYRDVYKVALNDAERMIKVLRRAEKAYLRAVPKAVTFGQYVTVIMKALGITTVMKESIYSADTLDYDGRDFQNWHLSDAAYLIDGQITADRQPKEVTA